MRTQIAQVGSVSASEGNQSPLVSVVIPAFNAAATLAETIASVLNQTFPNIEVIVVDDGSTDETARIAAEFSERDARVCLLQKTNEGVASARNYGIEVAKGEFIAPIDADDLWHPTRVEKHLSKIISSPDVALVYSPFRLIDKENRLISSSPRFTIRGHVILRNMAINFVGNGSGILIRRSVIQEFGGYSVSLRNMELEGCEDFLLQLHVASRYRFEVVPEYLIGYRQGPATMSANQARMDQSRLYVTELIGSAYMNKVLTYVLAMPVRRSIFSRRIRSLERSELGREVVHLMVRDPGFALYLAVQAVRKLIWLMVRSISPASESEKPLRFGDLDPLSPVGKDLPAMTRFSLLLLQLCEQWLVKSNRL